MFSDNDREWTWNGAEVEWCEMVLKTAEWRLKVNKGGVEWDREMNERIGKSAERSGLRVESI